MFLYNDSNISIYFGGTSDNLYQEYYLNLPRQPLLTLEPFAALKSHLPLNDLAFLKQVHGIEGAEVTSLFQDSFTQEGDYLITAGSIGLGVMTADCLPIVMYDTKNHALAMIHAGWRGSIQGIALKALNHMKSNFKSEIKNLQVFFGPAARSCCYEVGADFVKHLTPFAYASDALVEKNGQLYFDVPLFNTLQLKSAGISSQSINDSHAVCTICDERFFSYRRQKERAGRQMTVVCLK